jgi:hypothetical protein
MIEKLTGKYEFKHYLAPDTEEKVIIVGACLIGERNEVKVRINETSTADQELSNFLNVIKWLGVDCEFYQVVGDDCTILFINGSKIEFVNQ